MHNAHCTCRNCPAMDISAIADSRDSLLPGGILGPGTGGDLEAYMMARCRRQPDLGPHDPMTFTFEQCPEWQPTPSGYLLKGMRVMILGIDGYLGWTLALWLNSLGCQVSGVDNYSRRDCVKEIGAHSVVPIMGMAERLQAARETLQAEINFHKIDILN